MAYPITYPSLSLSEMESLLDEYVLENFTNEGMIAFVALHEPDKNGDPRNFHAHILLTLRRIDHSGFTGNKVRSGKLSDNLQHQRFS
jgi:hypothetical protein